MFKKAHFIFIILLLISSKSFAGFWDGLIDCITNPCNCGKGDRTEEWFTGTINHGSENPFCPPWNKTGGRKDHICLSNTDYPKNFIPWHLQHCAEQTTESNYFSPKIRVRYQACNIACWTNSATLSWDGQCVVWPTGYALPLLRICARVAVPQSSQPNLDPTQPDRIFPADPGYTENKHLNFEGFEADDEPVELEDGSRVLVSRPKLCAYKDPSLLDFSAFPPDLMDYNPLSQPIHKAQGLHPIAEVLLFFIDQGTSSSQSLGQMIAGLMDSIGSEIIPGLEVFKSIFDAIGEIIKYIGAGIKAAIEFMGQFNRVVDSYKFGCVEIPLGPYPPPFCPKLLAFIPTPVTQAICPIGISGLPINTSKSNKCVISNVVNNAIKNSIRISFDNFVPTCKLSENPLVTDKCIDFSQVTKNLGPSGLHISTARKDIIPVCSTSTSSQACVNTKILPPDVRGFRIVYGLKTGKTSTPIGYYVEDDENPNSFTAIPDCGSAGDVNATCQEIWGVNSGGFVDATLTFPFIENFNAVSPLTTQFTLKDKNNNDRTFDVSIVRQEIFDSINQFAKLPNQICVLENALLVGCQERMNPPKPKVYPCDLTSSPVPGISCSDNFYTPKFIAILQSGSDSTNIEVDIPNVHTSSSTGVVNLAGYDYEVFATDNNFTMIPFTGPKSINTVSIYGEYKYNKAPYDSSGTPVTDAIYLTGLEYVKNLYIQGGKYACLKPSTNEHCPANQNMCVLTNLINRDLVNCTDFAKLVPNYPNLRLCQSSDTNCTTKTSLPGKNGGSGITINECPLASANYCYTNTSNLEICIISQKPEDRFDPAPSLTPMLSDSDFYPAVSQSNPQYDMNLYGLRDKTPVEMQLCVDIVQPTCPAVNAPSSTFDGYALWPQTDVGNEAIGQCLPGYIINDPLKPLKRYCLSDANTQTVKFDKVDPTGGCLQQIVQLIFGNNDFPNDYGQVVTGNNQEGSVVFGARDTAHRIPDAGGSAKTYYMDLKFKVNHVAGLDYFNISELTYDDYLVIKVNGQKVYSGPDPSWNDISQSPNNEGGVWNDASNINLKPYLTDGDNLIRIDIKVRGAGILYYKIDYKFRTQ